MSPPTVNLAFLGCGNITRGHSRTLKGFAGLRRWYASRNLATAERYSRELGGAGAFGSYRAAMVDERVDTVMVATPSARSSSMGTWAPRWSFCVRVATDAAASRTRFG